jgi:uncharacterized protein YmfQ (DUF2313 family)
MSAPILFKFRSIAEMTDSLANFFPNGKLFISKFINETVFRNLLEGMAVELQRAQDELKIFSEGIIPSRDDDFEFVDEWERVVGIPDDCFSGTGENSDRRNAIVAKLATTGVQTTQDFVDLAAVFDIAVTVTAESDTPTSGVSARYQIRVTGANIISNLPPYDIPLSLAGSETFLECIFNKVKPSNCEVLFFNS